MNLFPYKPRRNQKAIMSTIKNILGERRDLVFESGTGSGKTICTISATLEYSLQNNKKIIYTTRTNAQQRQVLVELKEIRRKNPEYKEKIFGVGMQGRSNMCLLAKNDPELSKGTAEELSKICSKEKKKARNQSRGKQNGCSYYRAILEDKEKIQDAIKYVRKNLPTTEELIDYCEKKNICPYELNKLLLRDTPLVVVPYIYVFDKMIRNMLFDWLGKSEEDMILVVDEAHNLPDYIRDLFSSQLSFWMLNSCVNEAEKYGDPSILDGKLSVSGFCRTLIEIVRNLRDTYIYGILETGIRTKKIEQNDAFIPSHEFQTEILSRFNITSRKFHDVISDLIAYGEKIQEYRQKEGKLPRSFLHRLGLFLDFWNSLEMEQYAKLVVDENNGKNPRIEYYCLDPSLGAKIIKRFHSSIHMSGTLEPLEEYRDSLGLLENTELVGYPPPFAAKNRRIYYTSDVSTKYSEIANDEKNNDRMKNYISDIVNNFPKNTMVFFPSFGTMSSFVREGIKEDIDRCLFVEERGMSQSELMDVVSDFKNSSNDKSDCAAMFSVMGGRVSEGLDFPAEQLEIAIIVGIPYPKPTARQRGLQHYYDVKFRKGWEYIVEAPTARKLLQSIGRLIRDEDDKGVAVILDRRASRFKKYIPDLTESKNLIDDIKNFVE